MKKIIFIVCSASVAILSLLSCEKNDQPELKANAPAPAIYAYDASTKTALGTDWSVSWDAADNLTVFNAASGDDGYSDNCRFLISGTPSDGKFIKDAGQTDKSLVSGESSYDWYVCSPHMPYGSNPNGTAGYTIALSPKQVGYNSSAHLTASDIMAGTAFGIADGQTPSIALHHVATLMKFTVTNDTGEEAAITGLTLDAKASGSYITGSFTMDWGDVVTPPSLNASLMGSSKSSSCALSVVKNVGTEETPSYVTMNDKIANGASVDLYMVVAPFSIPANGVIKLTVIGSFGSCELEKKMPSGITFAAGTYNTASLSYTKPEASVFTETFGSAAVGTANVPSYNKSGLTTADASHSASYEYAVGGNASIQIKTDGNVISSNYESCGISPAYVRLPCTSQNSFFSIKHITVEANTTYEFRYNKVKGGGDSVTRFGWRENSTENWTYVNETTDEGTITQEFTTGEFTLIDIIVQSDKEGSHTPYTSLDLFKLIKK
ncbi:MAG: hypothetical protein IKZ91_00885 [Bacteroidales bacterium]|nr:hypothetical protein [Bacteroidales bacterium]